MCIRDSGVAGVGGARARDRHHVDRGQARPHAAERLAQPAFHSVPDHGVADLPADSEADPWGAEIIDTLQEDEMATGVAPTLSLDRRELAGLAESGRAPQPFS